MTMNNIYINVYLTNLGKYVEGELFGQRVDVTTDTDWKSELEAIDVVDGGRYEEYFITDYESNINIKIDEYTGISEIKRIAEIIEDLNENGIEADLFDAIMDCTSGIDEAYEIAVNDRYRFFDGVSCDEELGYRLVDDGYLGDVDDGIKNYLDYETIGRDYCIDTSGTYTDSGFIAID